jgi:protein-L-isoaspartate O-methyltransferase
MAHMQLGHFDQALEDFNLVLQLDPMSAAGHYSRGLVFQAQQQLDLALDDFQQAIYLDSLYVGPRQMLADLLLSTGRYSEAIVVYKDLVSLAGESPEIYHKLGLAHRHLGQLSEAVRCFQLALINDSSYIPAREGLLLLYQDNIQSWHFWMMNDAARNHAFQEAISRVVTPESLVLEIGTGSGLLAMMAAKAGAKKVVTCESESLIAAQAKQIVVKNGFGTQIEVVNKKSDDLLIPHDLSKPADVLIAEVFGAWLPSEGAFEAIAHALKHLLKPNARIVPSGANLYLMAIECYELHQRYWVDESLGFDLTSFNDFQHATPAFLGQIDQHIYRPLSDPYCFARLDFTGGKMDLTDLVVDVPAVVNGKLHGVCTWFDLLIDDMIMLTTGPMGDRDKRSRSWGQLTAMICPSLAINKDDIFQFTLKPYRNTIEVIANIQKKTYGQRVSS